MSSLPGLNEDFLDILRVLHDEEVDFLVDLKLLSERSEKPDRGSAPSDP